MTLCQDGPPTNSAPTKPSAPLNSILRLTIRGLGNPISFKNSKCIWKRRNGKPFIATKPEFKTWMQRAIRVIVSQLSSACPTTASGTTQECLRHFAMSSLPHDDCWQALEIGSVQTVLVPKGEEGCDIEITQIRHKFMQTLTTDSPMATRKEFDALYRTGKEVEAREEGRLPEMAGSTDFYDLLGKALAEAKAEGGKLDIHFNHPAQVRIRVFGSTMRAPSGTYGSPKEEFFLRREYTHYL